MTVLRRGMYRDPLDILIEQEQRTCKGCKHKVKIWGVEVCAKPGGRGNKAIRRCKDYTTGEGT